MSASGTFKLKFAVNTHGRDKEWDFTLLSGKFRDLTGALDDVIHHIQQGHAICAGLLGGKWRSKASFAGSYWVLAEIDNAALLKDEEGNVVKGDDGKGIKVYQHQMTLDEAVVHPFISQHCSLIYTTPSHTPDWHRFRLVFLLPEYVADIEVYEAMVRLLLEQLPHDPACKDGVRVFYGNTKAEFPLINPDACLPADWMEQAIAHAEQEKQRKAEQQRICQLKREQFRQICQDEDWNVDALIEQALTYIPPRTPGSGNYDECRQVLMALVDHYGAIEAEAIAEHWSPSINGDTWNIPQKIKSFRRSGITIGSLFHIAQQYGFRFPERKKQEWSKSKRHAIIPRMVTIDYRSLLNPNVDQAELLETLRRTWEEADLQKRNSLTEEILLLAAAHLPKQQADNLLISLGFDPDKEKKRLYEAAQSVVEHFREDDQFETLAGLRGGYLWSMIAQNSSLYDYLQLLQRFGSRLRFNTLKKQVELDGKAFAVGNARIELSIQFGFQPKTKADFPDIFLKAAKRNSYSPISEYLDQVAGEHGEDTGILDSFAKRYFGQSDPIYNSMLTRSLVAAVARAYNPGCKVDTALILQGKQGAGKSTFFKVLAGGDEYFDDSLGNVSEKDEKLKLHRAWLVEWAELETVFKRKDVANTKAFLSSSVDYVRPPYGRDIKEMPRSSVIVGTTNQDEFLSDSTGNRRFWVIPVLQDIDIELLRAERDRIWAAAVSLYKRGEQWWLTQAEEAAASNIAERFQTSDPWEEVVNNHVQHLEFVTINEILNLALKIELGKQDKACQMRVASILKQAGWEKVARRINGKLSKGWARPLPPDEESGQPPDKEAQVRVLLEKISTCTNWSDFERLGQEFSHSVRESAWKQLSKAERRRINQLKAHHNTSATRRTGNGEESDRNRQAQCSTVRHMA